MNLLLAFPGYDDPLAPGVVGGSPRPGPVLRAVAATRPAKVLLLSLPFTRAAAERTRQALGERFPGVPIRAQPLTAPVGDVPGLAAELQGLRADAAGGPDAWEHAAAVADAGPSEARAALWMLAALGAGPGAMVTAEGVVGAASAPPPAVREPGAGYAVDSARAVDRSTVARPGASDAAALGAARVLGIVGEDAALRRTLQAGAAVAPHGVPVLILGETGTGKELLARLVHRLSGRPADRFVPVNCGALPPALVESILFGHVKGAFTGAQADRPGKFVQADGGTLFLDELGELPLALQPRLLRVLEDGCVEPLGGSTSRTVDVRIVAATHRDLGEAVAKDDFREDLYYRLSLAVLRLPPLRERRADIPLLAEHLLERINGMLDRPKRLSPAALRRLAEHDWPGNVRDLENVLGRSVLWCARDELAAADLLFDSPRRRRDGLSGLPDPYPGFRLDAYLASVRRQLFLRALDRTGGAQAAAARLLGVSPQAVHKFVQSLSDPPPSST